MIPEEVADGKFAFHDSQSDRMASGCRSGARRGEQFSCGRTGMWTSRSEQLSSGRVIKFVIELDAVPISFAEVLRRCQTDEEFRSFFVALLADSPFSAFRWETPPITTATPRRNTAATGGRMLIGLVTDVHNHAGELAQALAIFRDRGVKQVITIGDTCDAFARVDGATEVAAMLDECGAGGVWGNHDFTLARDASAAVRDRYPPIVLSILGRMQPRLIIGDCHFSHKESSADPHDVAQLWDISDRPLDLMERARLAFAAVDSRWQFVGHYHRWWAATPAGPIGWSGGEVLRFEPSQRYFVVIAAVCDGWCGILDTDLAQVEPLRCGRAENP